MASTEPTLLGILDEEIKDDVETNWLTNKVGGKPDWVYPSADVECGLCGDNTMRLVCQIYCPLGQSHYHRTLYIFACINRPCWNHSESWTVLRSQILDTEDSSIKATSENKRPTVAVNDNWGMDVSDWGVDTDDWGEDTGDSKVGNGCEDEMSQERLISMLTNKENSPSSNTLTAGGKSIESEMSGSISESSDVVPESSSVVRENSCSTEFVRNSDNTGVTELDKMTSELRLEDTGYVDEDKLTLNGCNKENSKITESNSKNVNNNSTGCSIDSENQEISNNKSETVKSESESVTFKSYYVNVFEEPEESVQSLHHEQQLLKEYMKNESVDLQAIMDDSCASGGAESYEKTDVKHGDNTFHKFKKRLDRCPQQILRYEYGGKPLFMKQTSSPHTVPPCEYCGKHRQFELQLMPGMVSVLKGQGQQGCFLEFGTVHVYTCSESCWSPDTTTSSVCREHVFIEPDPDQHLFKNTQT